MGTPEARVSAPLPPQHPTRAATKTPESQVVATHHPSHALAMAAGATTPSTASNSSRATSQLASVSGHCCGVPLHLHPYQHRVAASGHPTPSAATSHHAPSFGVSLTSAPDAATMSEMVSSMPQHLFDTFERVSSTDPAADPDHTLRWAEVNASSCELLWPLVLGFRALCEQEFDHHELEDLETWQDNLRDGGETMPYVQTFSLLVKCPLPQPLSKQQQHPYVVGGAARELYPDSRCGLVSYIVVGSELRGKGFAQKFMRRAVSEMSLMLPETPHRLAALFIEVLQSRDAIPGKGFDAGARQRIWEKMGFLPLDFDLVHPGRLRGGRYQLAAFRETVEEQLDVTRAATTTSEVPATGKQPSTGGAALRGDFPVSVLRHFLHGLFKGIHLAACDDDDDAEGEGGDNGSDASKVADPSGDEPLRSVADPTPPPPAIGELDGHSDESDSINEPHEDENVRREVCALIDNQLSSEQPHSVRMGSGLWR